MINLSEYKSKQREFSYLRTPSPLKTSRQEMRSKSIDEFASAAKSVPRQAHKELTPVRKEPTRSKPSKVCLNCVNHKLAGEQKESKKGLKPAECGMLITTPTQLFIDKKRDKMTKRYTQELRRQLEERRRQREMLQFTERDQPPTSNPSFEQLMQAKNCIASETRQLKQRQNKNEVMKQIETKASQKKAKQEQDKKLQRKLLTVSKQNLPVQRLSSIYQIYHQSLCDPAQSPAPNKQLMAENKRLAEYRRQKEGERQSAERVQTLPAERPEQGSACACCHRITKAKLLFRS